VIYTKILYRNKRCDIISHKAKSMNILGNKDKNEWYTLQETIVDPYHYYEIFGTFPPDIEEQVERVNKAFDATDLQDRITTYNYLYNKKPHLGYWQPTAYDEDGNFIDLKWIRYKD